MALFCTVVEALVAHAFQNSIGNIVMLQNSIGKASNDVAYTQQAQNPINVVEGVQYESSTFSGVSALQDVINSASNASWTSRKNTIASPPVKRLDARGFFQSIPMSSV
jgi:hypothetical protein